MLVAEGALLLKFWFHLSQEGAEEAPEGARRGPQDRAGACDPDDWKHFKHYDEFVDVSEDALRETEHRRGAVGRDRRQRPRVPLAHRGAASWRDALKRAPEGRAPAAISPPAPPPTPPLDGRTLLGSFDYTRALDRERLPAASSRSSRRRLNALTRSKKMRERSLVMVFEGMDAAGKGGTIRRVTQALDARHYRVIPIAAPTEEERAQPYLWRFWRHVPGHGRTRDLRPLLVRPRARRARRGLLLARPTGCAPTTEINDFEEQLAEAGAIVVKFWLAITPEEQLRRFKAREETAYKRFKITAEDWRNRKKWTHYERAVCDMIDRTSTEIAPWNVIASERQARSRASRCSSACASASSRSSRTAPMSASELLRTEMAWAMGISLALALALLALRPGDRPSVRNTLILLGACALALVASQLTTVMGERQAASIAAEVAGASRGHRVDPPRDDVRFPRDPAVRTHPTRRHRRGSRDGGALRGMDLRVAAAFGRGSGRALRDVGRHHGGGRLLDARPRSATCWAASYCSSTTRFARATGCASTTSAAGSSDITWRHTKVRDAKRRDRRDPERVAAAEPLHRHRHARCRPIAVAALGARERGHRRAIRAVSCSVLESAVKDARIERVATDPAPSAVLMEIGAGFGNYALRYWLTDPQHDDPTDSLVRAHILAALARNNLALGHSAPARTSWSATTTRIAASSNRASETGAIAALTAVDLFRPLTPEERASVADHLVYAPFVAGDIMTRQGATAHWLYLIVAGEADVWIDTPEGRKPIATIGAGSVFGEMGMLTGEPRRATVGARTDVTCYRLDKSGFEQIIRARPDVADAISHVLVTRESELEALRSLSEARNIPPAPHADIHARIRAFFGLD